MSSQTDIHYKEKRSEVLIQTDAFLQEYDIDYAGIDGYHIASIVRWSEDTPSCVLFWREGIQPTQLCNNVVYAKELIVKYVTQQKKLGNDKREN